MSVEFLPEVVDYFEKHARILFVNGYFGGYEWAVRYVNDLNIDIKTTLPMRSHRPAPKHFDKYGKSMKYAIFRKSKRTSWYVFFKTYNRDGEKIFLVRYIANNHTIAQYL